MKKILRFNQKEAIKLGLSLDDLVFLDWFIECKNIEEKNVPCPVSYYEIAEQLPIIFKGTECGNNKKIRRMLSGALSNILTKTLISGENRKNGFINLTLNLENYRKIKIN